MSRALAVPDRRAQRIAWLRRRFSQHNRLVALVAVLTLLVAASLWYLLFAILYWLALIAAGMSHGMDARPPEILPAIFIYAAGGLLLVTWIAGTLFPERPPKDKKSPFEIAAEFVLAVPRATLAVWGNLSAWQRLDRREIELAAEFLERLAAEGRVPNGSSSGSMLWLCPLPRKRGSTNRCTCRSAGGSRTPASRARGTLARCGKSSSTPSLS